MIIWLSCSASQDGRIYVRKILEGNSEDGKVLEHILLALRLVGDWGTCHPRLCWHLHLQVFPISTPYYHFITRNGPCYLNLYNFIRYFTSISFWLEIYILSDSGLLRDYDEIIR